jgi:hypothetical protein
MADSTPLINIKRALQTLKGELKGLDMKIGVLKSYSNAQHQGHARQAKASAMKSMSHIHDDQDEHDDSDDSDWLPDQ